MYYLTEIYTLLQCLRRSDGLDYVNRRCEEIFFD